MLHQAGISDYFMRKMHSQTTLKYINILLSPCLKRVPAMFSFGK